MYASLIGAGVSQLWDLLRSQTKSPDASTPSSGTTPAATSTPGATTTGTGRAGALSSDLNSLLLDLQSSGTTPTSATASSTADPTTTVANDLQSVFSDLSKAGGAHGHHHHHADAQNASNGSATAAAAGSQQSGANPFQNLAASLLAYTKGQGLTASQSASTSLTA